MPNKWDIKLTTGSKYKKNQKEKKKKTKKTYEERTDSNSGGT